MGVKNGLKAGRVAGRGAGLNPLSVLLLVLMLSMMISIYESQQGSMPESIVKVYETAATPEKLASCSPLTCIDEKTCTDAPSARTASARTNAGPQARG